MADQTEKQWMQDVARRDEAAFRNIIERYQDNIYRYLFAMVRDENLAKDLSQETFLRVWRSAGSYVPDAPLEHWLIRIARNLAINSFQQKKPKVIMPLTESLVQKLENSDDTEALGTLIRREDFLQIGQLLDSLDIEDRDLLHLRFYENLNSQQISQRIGINPEAVRKRMSRLLTKIRSLMK
ncbi:RNA polymerase sigma factor [Planctomycetota bacterium]